MRPAPLRALALVVALFLWRRISRLQRRAVRAVSGAGRGDLLDFAVALQARVDDLHRAVDEVAAGLSRVDRRVDGAVTNTAVVRYDAYEGTGGQQSASVALLDATRTGTVVTAIQGRDYARIYVKDLDRGRSSVALSPEEQEAVDRAMSRAWDVFPCCSARLPAGLPADEPLRHERPAESGLRTRPRARRLRGG